MLKVDRQEMNDNRFQTAKIFKCALAVFCFVLASCGAGQDDDTLLGYTRTAEHQYMLDMDEFEDEDCIEASGMFLQIRKKFPYTRFAVLADLRIADCKFIMGNYSEAATKYQEFVKAHPTHEDAHYASYRRGLSYYEMAPSDLFIMPPAHERDLASMRDARMAFTNYFANYKDSPLRERALEIFMEVENALVRHEIYVAGFYLSRDDRNAAAVRLEGIQNEYPNSTLVPDAMFMQAVTFLEMDKDDEARRVFGEIIKHYPDHHQSKRAQKYLRYLDQKSGDSKRGENG